MTSKAEIVIYTPSNCIKLELFLLVKTKEDILKNKRKQMLVAIDLYSILWKSVATSNCLLAFFKISSFVFNRRNNSILEQLEDKKIMTEF